MQSAFADAQTISGGPGIFLCAAKWQSSSSGYNRGWRSEASLIIKERKIYYFFGQKSEFIEIFFFSVSRWWNRNSEKMKWSPPDKDDTPRDKSQ